MPQQHNSSPKYNSPPCNEDPGAVHNWLGKQDMWKGLLAKFCNMSIVYVICMLHENG